MSYANRGREWQQEVEQQHVQYARDLRATWIRNEPCRTVFGVRSDDDAIDLVVSGRGAPDYTVIVNPYVLLVEVKDCEGETWKPREVSRWQRARLTHGETQANVLSIVLLRAAGTPYLLVWADIAGLPPQRSIRPGEHGRWLAGSDYLEAALEIARSRGGR